MTDNNELVGASPAAQDRATHEPNPQAVSAVPVGIADAETFASIIQWGDGAERLIAPSYERIIDRAWEEWKEMIKPGADVPVEAADVIIVLLRIPGIAEAIQRKMAINRAREWRLMGDGTGYHISAQAMSPGTAKTAKRVEGRRPASAVPERDAPTPSSPHSPQEVNHD